MPSKWIFGTALLATALSAQARFDAPLGPKGGLKVECIDGCAGGGGGGGLTDAELRASAVPVSGTVGVNNFPATQTIAGSVTVLNQSAATNAVAVRCVNTAGSAFEACGGGGGGAGGDVNLTGINGSVPSVTNPLGVRLSNGTAFIDPRDRNWTITESVGVTGVFWPATQPVSGTFWQATQPVSGTFWQATQPVSGTVTANQGTANTAANRWSVYITDGTNNMPMADAAGRRMFVALANGGAELGTAGTGTGLTVTCTNCGGSVAGQTYTTTVLSAAAAASKDYLSLFNATGSGKIIKVLKIHIARSGTAAVVGVSANFIVQKTSSVGASCTIAAINPLDSTNASVPAQVTAWTNCTTDPGLAFSISSCSVNPEEGTVGKSDEICYIYSNNGGQPLTLRENEGVMVKTNALLPVGLVSVQIEFTM